MSSNIELNILSKLFKQLPLRYKIANDSSSNLVYVHRIASYYIKCFDFISFFRNSRDGEKESEDYKIFSFKGKSKEYLCVLNSSTFYLYWQVFYDSFKAGRFAIENFPYNGVVSENILKNLESIGYRLMKDIRNNSQRMKVNYINTGEVEYDRYFPRLSKPIIDEIDKVLAKYYGFTQEELDLIINYDIKYRMGKELEGEE